MAAITFTAQQLLSRANSLVGVLGTGEVMSAEVGQDSLAILNGLLDNWQTQRLTLPASGREVFSFTASTSTYSIGPTGTWNTTRPVQIDAMAVLNVSVTPNVEIPMAPLDDQSYDALTIKGLTAPFPINYYYNATTPNGSLFFYPTPTDAANYQAVLYTPTQVATFATLASSATLAPGYYRALYYNVAIELGLAFQRSDISPIILKYAADSLQDLKRINLEMLDLNPGAALPGTDGIYSIYSDSNF